MLRTPHRKDGSEHKESVFFFRIGVGLLVLLFVNILVFGGYILFNTKDIPPPDISDMVVPYPDVPEEDNAYMVFEEVLYSFSLSEEEEELMEEFLSGEAINHEQLSVCLDRFEEPLLFLEEGLERSRCVFPRPESVGAAIPLISEVMHLSDLLMARAQLFLQNGEVEEACDTVELHLRFANHITREPETFIQLLVGYAGLAQAYASLEQVLEADEVPTEKLLELREALLTSDKLQKGHISAIKSELHFVRLALSDVDALLDYTSGVSWEDVSTFEIMMMLSPDFTIKPNETTALFATYYRQHVEQIGRFYSEIDLGLGDQVGGGYYMGFDRWSFPSPNFGGEMMVAYLYPAFRGVHVKQIHLQGQADVLRIWIALRLFEKDHGRISQTLEELVPGYLSSVPLDLFDGKPIRYDPERRLIWLVGEDLIDQTGSNKLRNGERDEPENRRLTEDAVWEF